MGHIETLPSRVLSRIATNTSPLALLLLSSACRTLRRVICSSKDVWLFHRSELRLPPSPELVASLISDREIILLILSTRCPCCRETAGISVDWQHLTPRCTKCQTFTTRLGIDISDPHTLHWLISIRTFTHIPPRLPPQRDRTVRDRRRIAIVSRFAALKPVSIPIAILQECPSFERLCCISQEPTNLTFRKTLRLLREEVHDVRVGKELEVRMELLKMIAWEGVPNSWRILCNEVKEEKLISALQRELCTVRAYTEFPNFNPASWCREAKEIWRLAFDEYNDVMAEIMRKHPFTSTIIEQQQHERSVLRIFSNRRKTRIEKASDFKRLLNTQVVQDRLAYILPFPDFYFHFDGSKLCSPNFGVLQWFQRHQAAFILESDTWNNEAMLESRHQWLATISSRLASAFLHIIHHVATHLLDAHIPKEQLLIELEDMRRVHAQLKSTPELHIANVCRRLPGILNSSTHVWTNAERYRELDVLARLCRAQLTAPEWDEVPAFHNIVKYFENIVRMERSREICGTTPQFFGEQCAELYGISAGDTDLQAAVDGFPEWFGILKQRVSDVWELIQIKEYEHLEHMMECMLYEIAGQGEVNSFDTARRWWNGKSPVFSFDP
ncbi:hypothetical protein BC830DRAFT_1172638 [Chytriomyces sp. MP71]|nr:hypothetical protein BC830DRAFT_1172638 [Chytriomyces sp. MP71]